LREPRPDSTASTPLTAAWRAAGSGAAKSARIARTSALRSCGRRAAGDRCDVVARGDRLSQDMSTDAAGRSEDRESHELLVACPALAVI
jgi:hypothetical protein